MMMSVTMTGVRNVEKVKKNKGQTLVETAFVLPIILLVLMGIVEFGRIFNTYLVLTNASREGARVAAVGGADSDVINSVMNVTQSLNQAEITITIDPLETERTRGLPVAVTANYNLDLICPIINVLLPNPFPLASSTTMRIE